MFGKKQVTAVVEKSIEMVTNPVERAARTAVAMPVPVDVESEIEKLTAFAKELLPIEADTKTEIAGRIDMLRAARDLPYKRLSLEPLSWRGRKGYPLLAMYSLDSPSMQLSGAFSWEDRPNLPEVVHRAFRANLRVDSFSTITSTFSGVIPANVRAEIKKATPLFGDQLYIIAEAAWVETRRAADPLVVGYRAGALWLVAQFDLTDIEKYVISEFPG